MVTADAYRRYRPRIGRPFPSLMVDEEENIHSTKDTNMSHDAGWTPDTWIGIAEWMLGGLGTVMMGMGLFLWRLQLKVMLLEENYKVLAQDTKDLAEETKERHKENKEAHLELVGEMRNNRQALESFHRDLTRRIDNIWPSLNSR